MAVNQLCGLDLSMREATICFGCCRVPRSLESMLTECFFPSLCIVPILITNLIYGFATQLEVPGYITNLIYKLATQLEVSGYVTNC